MRFGDITIGDKSVLMNTICHAALLHENPTFVEVGVYKARTSISVMTILNAFKIKSKLICIDKDPLAQRYWNKSCKNYVGLCKSEFVLSDSWSFTPREKRLAWVFIDACHCYECVKKDLVHWAPLVAPGGFLIFHDADERQKNAKVGRNCHIGEKRRKTGVYKVLEDWDQKGFELFDKSEANLNKKQHWKGGANAYQKK